jgi:hypothetical protein
MQHSCTAREGVLWTKSRPYTVTLPGQSRLAGCGAPKTFEIMAALDMLDNVNLTAVVF